MSMLTYEIVQTLDPPAKKSQEPGCFQRALVPVQAHSLWNTDIEMNMDMKKHTACTV